jgi:hypothetical protein
VPGDEAARHRRTLAELRALAAEHGRQIEAVTWLRVNDLAVRWAVSPNTVRAVPREQLPYLLFGRSRQRRYDPRDVEAFEARAKNDPPR